MTKPRLEGVDALRGIAAVSVIFLHAIFYNLEAMSYPNVALVIAFQSSFAVEAFFIISAFSLYYGNFETKWNVCELLYFAKRRLLRIGPLYWFMLVVWVLYNIYFLYPSGIRDIIIEATFLSAIIPGQAVVHGGWTIGIEAVFYLFFPALILFIRSLKSALIALAISCFAAVLEGKEFFHTFLGQLPTFMAGIVAFFLYQACTDTVRFKKKHVGASIILGTLLYFVAISIFVPVTNIESLVWHAPVVIGLAFLILGVSLFPVMIFVNPATELLGRLSYGIYLIHMFVIVLLRPNFTAWLFAMNWANPWFPLMLNYFITVIITIAAALLAYRFVESPSIQFSKRRTTLFVKEVVR